MGLVKEIENINNKELGIKLKNMININIHERWNLKEVIQGYKDE